MKSFTTCLAVFVAAFVLVRCDLASDLKALTAKIVAEYQKMSLNETKTHFEDNLNHLEVMWTGAVKESEKEGLVVVAEWYKTTREWFTVGLKSFTERMNKMEGKERIMNWMEMGIAFQLIRDTSDMKIHHNVSANPTEAEAKKSYEEKGRKVLHILKSVADMLRKKADKQFWADLHQDFYEFNDKEMKKVETEMTAVKTTELRARNYQALANFLQGVLDATQFRAQPAPTFFAKVGQKLKELADKIKSIF